MASILSGEIQSPKIQYYVNEKKNAIAPKITNTGADTLQTQVNSTFSEIVARTVSDTLNSTADNLSRNAGSLSGSITTALQETQQNLLDYQTAIQDFQLLCENANENVDSQRQVLVEARTVLSSGKEAVSNTQSLLKDSRSATASLTGTLGASVEQSSSLLGRLSQTSSSALSQLESGSMSAAGKAENILASVQSLLDINQECINLLEQLNSSLPIPLDSIDTLLEEFSAQAERQQGILDNLTETCLAVETTAQTSKETREKLSSLASEGQSKIEELHSTLQENLSPQLNNTLDNFNLTAGNLTGILTASETSLNSLPAVLDEMQDSLASISEAMADTSQVLASAKEHLEKIETEITTASSSELLPETFVSTHFRPGTDKRFYVLSGPAGEENLLRNRHLWFSNGCFLYQPGYLGRRHCTDRHPQIRSKARKGQPQHFSHSCILRKISAFYGDRPFTSFYHLFGRLISHPYSMPGPCPVRLCGARMLLHLRKHHIRAVHHLEAYRQSNGCTAARNSDSRLSRFIPYRSHSGFFPVSASIFAVYLWGQRHARDHRRYLPKRLRAKPAAPALFSPHSPFYRTNLEKTTAVTEQFFRPQAL